MSRCAAVLVVDKEKDEIRICGRSARFFKTTFLCQGHAAILASGTELQIVSASRESEDKPFTEWR